MRRENKVLVIGEAFYPEDFLINDLVQEWEKDGYDFEVLTRAPSYPLPEIKFIISDANISENKINGTSK